MIQKNNIYINKRTLNQEIKIKESYKSTININDYFLITKNETKK